MTYKKYIEYIKRILLESEKSNKKGEARVVKIDKNHFRGLQFYVEVKK